MAVPVLLKARLARRLLPIALIMGLAIIGIIVLLVIFLLPAASNKTGSAAGAASGALPCSADTGGELNGEQVPDEYEEAIKTAASSSGVSAPILAAQLAKESSWNPNATSPSGARGLAQFMPGTWQTWGQGKDPFDPLAAIEAQGTFMGELLKLMQKYLAEGKADAGQDPIALALAGYNAGPGRIPQYRGIPPFSETQTYVQKILQSAQNTYGSGCAAGAGGIALGPGQWTSPLPGAVLTSPYGPRWGVLHAGIDLAMPKSQGAGTVLAAADMQITHAGCKGDGYGCSVVGIGSDGLQFRYGHMATDSIQVTQGQTVTAGTPLGTEGATGQVTGVHLHFEIYAAGAPTNAYASSGKSIDPLPVLKAKGVQV